MHDVWVQSFEHLKDKPSPDRALETLKKLASLVKPIMRKHGWVLPVLAEFFPDNGNLLGLNVNMGQKILVRLRPAHSPGSFLPQEDIVGTMLHELTHNVHGPHDEKFYKYLAGLEEEFYALQRSGYAGEGFYSEGKRLGTNVSHNLPPHVARQKALEAAEKRRQTAVVLGGGGSRLGGAARRNAGLTPREMAAQAAERRKRDQKSCASGLEGQQEADKAAKESVVNRVIDLTQDDDDDMNQSNSDSDSDIIIVKDIHRRPPDSTNPRASPSKSGPSTVPKVPGKNTSTSRAATKKAAKPSSSKKSAEWSCSACTLLNPQIALQCDACNMRRPLDDAAGWTCPSCGEQGIPHEFWSCRWCSEIKVQS